MTKLLKAALLTLLITSAHAGLEIKPPKTHPIKPLKPWQKSKVAVGLHQNLEIPHE